MSYSGGFSTSHLSSSSSESSKNTIHQAVFTQEERFNQILVQADQLIKKQQIQRAIERLRLLSQKINFLKQNKRDYDRKLQLVCIYNLAAAHQKQWNLDQCIPHLQKFISITKICLQENLKSSAASMQQATPNKHWFKLKTVQVKAMLQYCAVLSQIGEHRKAFKVAVEITNQLKNLFRRGMDQCSKQIAKREANHQKKTTAKEGKGGKGGADKIQFSFSMLLSARQILQVLMNMQTYNDIIERSSIQGEMQEVKSKIYYWKSNPQNNIKTLRQSFGIAVQQPEQAKRTNDRNLLGIKRGHNWVEEFTIAKIMFMTPLNYLQFSDSDNLIFQFNNRNLVEKIILLSVAYFSLSIELRFLQEETQMIRKKGKQERKKQEQHSIKQLHNSQIFHLKSIQIVCKHIKQNSAFISHLVNNYHKHYQNNLNTIEEQNSLAQYSELYEAKKRILSNLEAQEDIEEEINKNFNLAIKTPYRKDSIYYKEQISVKDRKSESPEIAFKKKSKKLLTDFQQDKTQKSNKLGSSTSFSRLEDHVPRDKTTKKIRVAHMVTVGKLQLQQLQKHDKSQKQISSKIMSSKSIKQKSLSKNKNFLKNSVTLKQNKSASSLKQRASKQKTFRDLKQSGDLKRDFVKKKSPEPSRALDLLKKSGSLYELSGKNLKQSRRIYTSSQYLQYKKKH